MREKRNARPPATEAQIREMHERARGAEERAAEHEAVALKIITEGEQRREQRVNEADQHADAYVQKAQETAAEMVAQARAQAEEDRRRAQAEADEDLRQVHIAAQMKRNERDAEVRDRDYWNALAAEETVHAGLPSVPPTAPLEQVPVTRTDNEVTQ